MSMHGDRPTGSQNLFSSLPLLRRASEYCAFLFYYILFHASLLCQEGQAVFIDVLTSSLLLLTGFPFGINFNLLLVGVFIQRRLAPREVLKPEVPIFGLPACFSFPAPFLSHAWRIASIVPLIHSLRHASRQQARLSLPF